MPEKMQIGSSPAAPAENIENNAPVSIGKKKREEFIGSGSKRPTGNNHGPGSNRALVTETPKNCGRSWGRMLSYSRPELPAIIIAMLFALIGTVIALIGPGQIQKITDYITAGMMTGIDLDGLTRTCTLLIILYGVSWVMNFSQHFIMATVSQKISRRFRTDITEKTNRMPLKYFDSTPFGDILSRITNDIDTIGQTLKVGRTKGGSSSYRSGGGSSSSSQIKATHKVKSGETLYSIATKYGTTVAKIKSANGLRSDNIGVGQTLKIPR